MNFFVFVIFLFCNLIVVLVSKASYGERDKYADGMLMGVHIPAEEINNEEVRRICSKNHRIWGIFHWTNLAAGCLLCFISFLSIEKSVVVCMIWLTEYLVGLYCLVRLPQKEMYQLKQKNGWIDEKTRHIIMKDTQPVFVDDDEYWKHGWYSNPNDSRILVQDRMSSFNMTFNMARPAAKIICGILAAVIVGVLVWVGNIMLLFGNAEVTFETNGSQVQFKAAGYECSFDISKVQAVEMIQELPDESFSRTNGGDTDQVYIGHFRGKETGTCMMFLHKGYSPIIKVTLEDQVIFSNSKQPGEVEQWFRYLTSSSKSLTSIL